MTKTRLPPLWRLTENGEVTLAPFEPHVFKDRGDGKCIRCSETKYDATGHWRKP